MLLLGTVGGLMWQIWEQITKFPTMTKLDLGVDCGLTECRPGAGEGGINLRALCHLTNILAMFFPSVK